jgi:Rrf2 family cysteine metabolism transcriptional repressor
MIRLSTKGRYGTRSMLELALRRGQGPVLIKDVAEAQQIPVKYLEHVLTLLRVAGLVKAYRGPRGGYVLARAPKDIDLREILEALEGPLALVHCVEIPDECPRYATCITQDIWGELTSKIREVMEGYTLERLVQLHLSKLEAAKKTA